MTAVTAAPWLPWLALAAVGAIGAAYLAIVLHRGRLQRRPILLLASLLGTLPVLQVALAWSRSIETQVLQLQRPALAVPCAITVAFVAHRLLRLSPRQGRVRRALTELLICASALAAALAALGATLGRPLDRLAIIVAIDRSRSIDLVTNASDPIRAELQVAELGMRDGDLIGTVVFAAEAIVEVPLRPRTRLPPPQQVQIGRDGTDLGAAIRRALAEVPADAAARIVVLSDGVSTRGDPVAAAAAAVAAGVPIDVVPLDQAKMDNVRMVGLRMPSRANQGESLELRVVTESSHPANVELRLFRDGDLLGSSDLQLERGEDVTVLRERAPGPGLHRYDVELSAHQPSRDLAPEDNRGSAFVRVHGAAAALVMERNPEHASALVGALEAASFEVDTVGVGAVPADVSGFAAYDLVVLSDIHARDLARAQLVALATYVRDLGGGLLLMGGDGSMGPGGYGKTAVEAVSPVSFDLKQERRRASLAEVIAIDTSGSMAVQVGAHTKLQLANDAAVRSAQLLGAGDRLGVMHVDTSAQWTLPIGPVTGQSDLAGQIRAAGPGGGGIYVDLTLKTAYAALHQEAVNLKHLLLLSDGDDAEQRAQAPALVSDAKRRGITTSVVALGRGGDVAALEQLSRLGGGRFYLVKNASRLPAVFAQETILAARSAINEVTFRVARAIDAAPTRGVDFSQAPALDGYVVTLPKGRAQVLLRGPEGDPVLATWSAGLGRSAAFTSDYKDRWGQRWTTWEGAPRLFAQLGRDLTRDADDPHVRLDAEASDAGQLRVRATVVDDHGRMADFRRLTVRVRGPDGFRRDVPLEAVGAGSYAATIPLVRPGAFIATAVDDASGEPVATSGAVLSAGEELRPTGTDRGSLSRIAALTGGKMRATLAGIFTDRERQRFAYQSLTPLLILLTAGALLLGVAARRLVLPAPLRDLPGRLRAARQGLRPRAGRVQSPATGGSARLLSAEQSGTASTGPAPRFAATPAALAKTPQLHAKVEAIALPSSPPARAGAPDPRTGAPSAEAGSRTDAPPPARAMTSVELLLARRKGRR